jgi:hypothetical protein
MMMWSVDDELQARQTRESVVGSNILCAVLEKQKENFEDAPLFKATENDPEIVIFSFRHYR